MGLKRDMYGEHHCQCLKDNPPDWTERMLILFFFLEEARQNAWDNIVTCHQEDKEARTWSFQRKCIGTHHLKSHTADNKAGPVMVCICPVFLNRNKRNQIKAA